MEVMLDGFSIQTAIETAGVVVEGARLLKAKPLEGLVEKVRSYFDPLYNPNSETQFYVNMALWPFGLPIMRIESFRDADFHSQQ